MAEMTPQEQLMLELINRARMDPNGEAKRMGIKLNEGVSKDDKISAAPKQVLAGNDALADAAGNHSRWMIDNDIFSHQETKNTTGFTGVNPSDRTSASGYPGGFVGENISFRGSTTNLDATNEIIRQHADLFIDEGVKDRGHRTNMLLADFREAGIGQDLGKYSSGGTNWNASMVTQNFGASGNTVFVTGVVYTDNVKKDDFFSVGEQVKGLAVDGGGPADITGSGGGYELQYASGGTKTVTFGGGMSVELVLGGTNIKLDLVNDSEVWSNATIKGTSAAVTELHLLGIAKADLHGADSGQAMFGNAGVNTFEGNGGADSFVFEKGTTGKTQKKADTIADFSQADGDIIDLSPWDANAKKGGNQAFDFIGGEKFHGKAGELRFDIDGNDTWIQADTNGDRKADLTIHLDGAIALVASDFDL